MPRKLIDNEFECGRLVAGQQQLLEQVMPAPRCICFYNGITNIEDKVTLKLSDAFKASSDIEVTVTMINVNYGHNKELMDACKPLAEYSMYDSK